METILVPTDFSPAANNAARYALNMAKAMKAGIILCNAMKVPSETPLAAQVVWPLEDYEAVNHEASDELHLTAEKLELAEMAIDGPVVYHPKISCVNRVGTVNDVVKKVVAEEKTNLVVMGMSGAGTLNRLFLGSNSRDLIDDALFPILLIPAITSFKGIHKIAFSTDLSPNDVEVVLSLCTLAAHFNAEILIAHITDETYDTTNHQRHVDAFLNEISGKVNYPKIYYRHIKSLDVDRGLGWLTEHGQIDMMTMVHRPQPFFSRLIKGSHTQKLARHIHIPLLVFPPNCRAVI